MTSKRAPEMLELSMKLFYKTQSCSRCLGKQGGFRKNGSFLKKPGLLVAKSEIAC